MILSNRRKNMSNYEIRQRKDESFHKLTKRKSYNNKLGQGECSIYISFAQTYVNM